MNGQTQARLVDAAVDAFVDWREECASVQDAYERWGRASVTRCRSAFAAYWAAVDREERAADVYAELMTRLARLLQPPTPPAGVSGPNHGVSSR